MELRGDAEDRVDEVLRRVFGTRNERRAELAVGPEVSRRPSVQNLNRSERTMRRAPTCEPVIRPKFAFVWFPLLFGAVALY